MSQLSSVRRPWPLLLMFVLAGFSPLRLAAQEDDEETPRHFALRKTRIPEARPGVAETYLNQVVTRNNELVAEGAFISYFGEGKPRHTVRYPGLRFRNIVPAFEGVYVVTGVTDGGPHASFSRLPMEGIEIPEGAKVAEGACTFVFGAGGGMHRAAFDADHVPATAKEPARVKIRLNFQMNEAGQFVVPPTMPHTQTAGIGEDVQIDDKMHKIVNIVPPNEKTKVIGWFGLSKDSKKVAPVEKAVEADDPITKESTKAKLSPE